MKKTILFFVILCLCVMCIGCKNSEKGYADSHLIQLTEVNEKTENTSIEREYLSNFLLFSGEGEINDETTAGELQSMTTGVTPTRWDITNGILKIEEKTVMTVKSDNATRTIHSWDGGSHYYIDSFGEIIDLYTENAEIEYYDYQFSTRKYITDECLVEVDEAKDIVRVMCGEESSEYWSDKDFLTIDGSEVPTNTFYFMCAGVYKDEVRITFVAFSQLNDDYSDFLAVLTYNIKSKKFCWNEPAVIPTAYLRGVHASYPGAVMYREKVYFSVWDGIAYLDTDDMCVIFLDDVSKKITTFLGDNATRYSQITGTIPIFIGGKKNDILICSASFRDIEDRSVYYQVDFALSEETVIGSLVYSYGKSFKKFTTYDKDFNEVNSYDVSNIPIRTVYRIFETDSFLLY